MSYKAKKQQLQHDMERKNKDLAILDYSCNNFNVQNNSIIDQAYDRKNTMEYANVRVKKESSISSGGRTFRLQDRSAHFFSFGGRIHTRGNRHNNKKPIASDG